jgi:predicted MFS family arabinose efflux permease
VSLADVSGGAVAWAFGTSAAFDLSVAIMLAASALALRLPPSPPAPEGHVAPSLAGLGRACRRPGVAWVLAWYAVVFVGLRVGFQLYQPTLLHLGATNLALHGGVLGLLNLTAGLAALFVLRVFRRFGERRTATGVALLVALSFAGLAQVSSLAASGRMAGLAPLLMAGALLFGLQQVAFGFLQPLGRTALNQRIPSANRTGMLSAQSMTARLSFSALLFLGTWDAAVTRDLPATYGWLALMLALLALLLHLGHRRSHRLPPEHGNPSASA